MEEQDGRYKQMYEAEKLELARIFKEIIEGGFQEQTRLDDVVVDYTMEQIDQERRKNQKIEGHERTELYKVIKDIREGKPGQEMVSRLFVSCKLLEIEKAKSEYETNISQWINNASFNYKTTLTGYMWIKGIYCLHLLEGDSKVLNLFLKFLHDEKKRSDTVLQNVSVLAFNEDNPSRWFHHWGCSPDVLFSGQHREDTDKLDEEQQRDIIWNAYENFYQASVFFSAKLEKEKKISKQLWKDVSEKINPGNEDLFILTSHLLMSIEEYFEMYLDELEIELDSELHFPQLPTMIDILQYNDEYSKSHENNNEPEQQNCIL